MAFTAADVKTLREMTSVGMMDCKERSLRARRVEHDRRQRDIDRAGRGDHGAERDAGDAKRLIMPQLSR